MHPTAQKSLVWHQANFDESWDRVDIKSTEFNNQELIVYLNDESDGKLQLGKHYTHLDSKITILHFQDIPQYHNILAMAGQLHRLGFNGEMALVLPLCIKVDSKLHSIPLTFSFRETPKIMEYKYIFAQEQDPGSFAYDPKDLKKITHLINLNVKGMFDIDGESAIDRTLFWLENYDDLAETLVFQTRTHIANYFKFILDSRRLGRLVNMARWCDARPIPVMDHATRKRKSEWMFNKMEDFAKKFASNRDEDGS